MTIILHGVVVPNNYVNTKDDYSYKRACYKKPSVNVAEGEAKKIAHAPRQVDLVGRNAG